MHKQIFSSVSGTIYVKFYHVLSNLQLHVYGVERKKQSWCECDNKRLYDDYILADKNITEAEKVVFFSPKPKRYQLVILG